MEIKPLNRPPRKVIEGFRSVGTSTISDIFDEMKLDRVISGLRAIKNGMALVGPAVTIKEVVGVSGTYDLEDFPIGEVIDCGISGDVLVFDVGGAQVSTWGGLASTAAQIRGIEGVVIDGGCRDADQTAQLSFPVFSRHVTPITGKSRIKILDVNGVIQCSGVRIKPGDIIAADSTGVVVIPQEKALEILEKAQKAESAEERFAEELKKGKAFSELQKKTPHF